jgi:hypothetical protein
MGVQRRPGPCRRIIEAREGSRVRSLTIEAKSLESAQALYSALSGFRPELRAREADGYWVTVDVGGSDQEIVAVLDALVRHVSERADGPAHVVLDGRQYSVHPD